MRDRVVQLGAYSISTSQIAAGGSAFGPAGQPSVLRSCFAVGVRTSRDVLSHLGPQGAPRFSRERGSGSVRCLEQGQSIRRYACSSAAVQEIMEFRFNFEPILRKIDGRNQNWNA
jgi:hypothetical protein